LRALTWRALREALWLLAAAAILTAASWALRNDGLPLRADPTFYNLELEAPLITPGEALAFYNEGLHLFIDTRPGNGLDQATIPGAFPVRQSSFDDDLLDLFDFIAPTDPLILFGDGNLLPISAIAARLKDRGYPEVSILDGGLDAWRKAGGPVKDAGGGGS